MSASDMVLQSGTVSGSEKSRSEYGVVGARIASEVKASKRDSVSYNNHIM